MIHIDRVTVKIGNKIILNDVSLTLNNEIYELTGENGSGKSTFLKFLSGNKKSLSGYFYHPNTFYLPEKFILPREIKVSDFISIYSSLKNAKYDAHLLLSKYGIDPDSYIKSLSKGMLQKVGIIASLIGNYDLVLYDEPFEGLDDASTKMFLKDLEERYNNKTVVIVYHEKSAKVKTKFKSLIIEDGKICEK